MGIPPKTPEVNFISRIKLKFFNPVKNIFSYPKKKGEKMELLYHFIIFALLLLCFFLALFFEKKNNKIAKYIFCILYFILGLLFA